MSAAARELAWWPAPPAPGADGLVLVGVRGDGGRDAARLRIRAALRATLARLADLPQTAIMIQSGAGRAPVVSFSEPARITAPGIAISHDGPFSLAAIHLHGAVGVDLMQVQDIPDWREVVRDYLGPRVLAALAALPPPARAPALARAWTEREARLKCLGLPLGEWDAPPDERATRCLRLALPAGFVGTVAVKG